MSFPLDMPVFAHQGQYNLPGGKMGEPITDHGHDNDPIEPQNALVIL